MIAIRGLEFAYPGSDFRLRVPELGIDRGSTVALIGPSGSGKTTLLNLISGVTPPSAGGVLVQNTDVTRLSDAERRDFRIRRIGMVFQEFELLDYLDVLDNILLPYRVTGALTLHSETKARARQLAEAVGLADKLSRNVQRLSQGERQRVAVCRALLPEPPLLLCDEPTGNLDPVNKDHVLDILFGWVEQHDTTLVVVTHDHELLPRFDRVVDFRSFQVVEQADASGGAS